MSKRDWKSSSRLTDEQIKSIFSEMDEKGCGWITLKDIEKRFIRLGSGTLLSLSIFSTLSHTLSLFLLEISRVTKCLNSSCISNEYFRKRFTNKL